MSLRHIRSSLIRALHIAIDKRLSPPSGFELSLVNSLRSTCASLREIPGLKTAPHQFWEQSHKQVVDLILTADVRRFLQWPIIQSTMFVRDAPYVLTELISLRRSRHWRNRWHPALKEVDAGAPAAFFLYPRSSGNLIHQAYHIFRFEEATAQQIHDFDYILEFGGGYGCMCRLAFALGFKGTYIIADLPVFTAIQRYWLSCVGLSVRDPCGFGNHGNQVILTSTLDELRNVTQAATGTGLAIATWSLSEAPSQMRQAFIASASKCDAFLFAYQEAFEDMSNVSFPFDLKCGLAGPKDLTTWREEVIRHMPSNRYLFGARRRDAVLSMSY